MPEFPQALAEKDFVIPGPGDESLLCGEARRNLTDQQETSQWLGGVGVAKAIMSSLMGTSLNVGILFEFQDISSVISFLCFSKVV